MVWSTPDGVPWNSDSISAATSSTSESFGLFPAAAQSAFAQATLSAPELPSPIESGRSLSTESSTFGAPVAFAAFANAVCSALPFFGSIPSGSLQPAAAARGGARGHAPATSGPATAGWP